MRGWYQRRDKGHTWGKSCLRIIQHLPDSVHGTGHSNDASIGNKSLHRHLQNLTAPAQRPSPA